MNGRRAVAASVCKHCRWILRILRIRGGGAWPTRSDDSDATRRRRRARRDAHHLRRDHVLRRAGASIAARAPGLRVARERARRPARVRIRPSPRERRARIAAKRRKTHATPNASREDHFRPRAPSRFPPPAVRTVDSFQGSEAAVRGDQRRAVQRAQEGVATSSRGPAEAERGADEGEERVRLRGVRPHVARVRLGDLRALVRLREPGEGIATEAEARAWLELLKFSRAPTPRHSLRRARARRANSPARRARRGPPRAAYAARRENFFSSVEDPSEIRPRGRRARRLTRAARLDALDAARLARRQRRGRRRGGGVHRHGDAARVPRAAG